MKKNSIIIPITLAILIFSGCYYDNLEAIHPELALGNSCDTTSSITYSKQLTNIFSGYCTSCHSSSNPTYNIILDTYTGAKNAIPRLLGSVKHTSGYYAMPPGTQIDQCSIREIEIWIGTGTLQ